MTIRKATNNTMYPAQIRSQRNKDWGPKNVNSRDLNSSFIKALFRTRRISHNIDHFGLSTNTATEKIRQWKLNQQKLKDNPWSCAKLPRHWMSAPNALTILMDKEKAQPGSRRQILNAIIAAAACILCRAAHALSTGVLSAETIENTSIFKTLCGTIHNKRTMHANSTS